MSNFLSLNKAADCSVLQKETGRHVCICMNVTQGRAENDSWHNAAKLMDEPMPKKRTSYYTAYYNSSQ